MRFIQLLAMLVAALVAQPALAAVSPTPAPFAGAAVSDDELDLVRGTHGVGFRMTDELSITSLRQTAMLSGTMRDLWLIDVASPLIAANVRAAAAN